ncbi:MULTISPECIES: phenylalanine--tRNA ligase subunit beta [Streptomyces]|uniref:Phenylalanine--tRNA ligase beta subunit n=1 Tax=Streptomyces thermoviolaceus subsp. thermoviolaceus TaxID=66860 RepID=A0ABX0YKF0_STRTL|nr:phenylalanine--tRNA ligase subunit beta [Streptomyces thermoviolaceus]MCM3263984.1 phenylalanine--tRNA ligase subunit beta [Streptomyces thermoviolaceus]NJP12879.1 phenylalanine--tRNA ligase subunit beta [Streptomyces thermoviolaceus subsp. thermoviolaceus]WTD49954.1 phenylalanine--tRNA ligase subunit beta [Streptomyces thermoviolaceus]GGV67937.1 phenylalanine--tRNA ligase beta subunit [Streptomyces thermoviolaceus subsp. apingens]GHA81572.1 phenylalanine--tRNA ligase beta subunit [Streptom
MRVPLSWLREYVDLPATETGRDVQAKLISAGLEVETVEQLGADLKGPLVVGQVLSIEELEGFKKPIRFCTVDVGQANGTGEPQEIVCGARNFSVGDKVVVVLPGGVLPGGFQISSRKTYGRMSHGMICSADELGMGDDGTHGIIVLPPEHEVGTDAIELLQLVDEVLDIAVTPDRGYCLSMRGVAREAAIAYGRPLLDPALLDVPAPNAFGHPVQIADPHGCDRFTARTVTGIDPEARTPIWMQRRLQKAGMRPISLPVDITNYVMLEMGQPLHAYDRTRIQGAIGVRRAERGEKLTTLDGVTRELSTEDLVITDERGPIGLAGVMGGAHTEIDDSEGTTTEVVIEAAHFDPVAIARTARRHKLSTEASRRFERGVDPQAASAAAQRCVDLLVLLAGGTAEAGVTEVVAPSAPRTVTIPADHPDKVAGVTYGRETVVRRLQQIGCDVYGQDELTVTVPSWRPDLTDPNDLAEEVIRLEGYENLPSRLPRPLPGRGLTPRQRLHRRVGRALAGAGYVEAPTYPFLGQAVFDQLGLEADDPRRSVVTLVNPLSDEEPALRTTLLPGLLGALRRNDGRGSHDLALFETGSVFLPTGAEQTAERLPADRRPTDEQLAALDAALPDQPRRVAVVLAGAREQTGWWGKGRPADWADAVEAARLVAREAGVEPTVRAAQYAPWHPGRCAALYAEVDGTETLVGHAGELHPRVVKTMHLPERTCAMEVDLDLLERAGQGLVKAPRISTFPVATQDVALVVDSSVPAADVEAALREGAGDLLESIRLFDLYENAEQLGEGRRSLAYALRFRAPDRTLTVDEASAARDAAVALAAERTGAVLRS